MSKKIFVGNLSYQTTEGDLSNLFEQVGQVESVNIITDRAPGRSKGFGSLEMGRRKLIRQSRSSMEPNSTDARSPSMKRDQRSRTERDQSKK